MKTAVKCKKESTFCTGGFSFLLKMLLFSEMNETGKSKSPGIADQNRIASGILLSADQKKTSRLQQAAF